MLSGVLLFVLGTQPAAAALPSLGAHLDLPGQRTGSAAGQPHQVGASATRARKMPHGHRAEPVPGAVPGAPKRRSGRSRRSFTPAGRTAGKLTHPPASAARPQHAKAAKATTSAAHGDSRLPGRAAKGTEVTADRRANVSVFRDADGTMTARVYSRPVHYRTAGGSWADIDDSLVSSGGRWKEKADAPAAGFARTGDAPALVSYGPSSTQRVSYGLAGARAVTGRVDGNAITYPGIRASSDVSYAATASGVKETLVLHSASAPTTWTFPLTTAGLTPSVAADGSVHFTDAAGKVVERIPHGFMEDADTGKASGEGAVSTGVTYRLTTSGGRPALRVTLDPAWLHDPSRVFPVKVDPTSLNTSADTYVETPYDINFSTDDTLKVGSYDDGGHKADSYLKFDSFGSTFKNDYIEAASLYLDDVWSGGCTPEPVYVSPITSSWANSTIAKYPGLSYGSHIGSSTFSAGAGCDGSAWHGIDIGDNPSAAGVEDLEKWAHGGTDLGLALTANTSVVAAWKQFASANSSYPPYLSVTYSSYGADYSIPATSYTPPTASTTGSMQVRLTNRGTSSWTTSNMKLGANIYSTKWTLLQSEAAKTSVPSTVPANSSVTMTGSIPEVSPGEYYVCWDMLLDGSTSFSSTYHVPMGCAEIVSVDTPPQIDSTDPLSDVTLGSLTPELYASGSDPDGYPGSGVSYDFQVYSDPPSGTPALLADSGSTSTPNWVVPSGKLAWNQAYYWTVSDSDGDADSAWSDPSTFSTAVPQPLITSHLGGAADDGGGHDVDPQIGNYTTAAADADVSVAGPALAVSRSYNSLDPRTATLFGAGWSTPYDMAVQPDDDGTGDVVLTDADGRQQRFGLDAATGDYTAPAGQFETLAQLTGTPGGWSLTVKSGTTYTFRQPSGTAWRLTGVTDPAGHTETLAYRADGTLATVTNTTSDRSLHFTWSGGHVTEVDTDPVTSGGAAEKWTYAYTGDELTAVCPPTSSTACTDYTYTSGTASGSHYRSAVLDAGPASYWRLADPSGTTATSDVAVNEGNDDGTYSSGVTLGAAGPLPGSPTTAATFDGTGGHVSLPPGLADSVTYATVTMWFKTTGAGVLFSYQKDAVTNATTPGDYTPVLYVGTSGKLYGQLWRTGGVSPIATTGSVADGDWHQVALTAAGTTQSLYLDGSLVGTLSGQLKVTTQPVGAIGAGFLGGSWPDEPHYLPGDSTGYASHFAGQIAEAAFYTHALGAPAVQRQYAAGTHPATELTGITLPSGKTRFHATYDAVHDRAGQITDANGQTWDVQEPTTTGSDAYYRSSVLGSTPVDYWRLGDSSGTDAVNEVAYAPGNTYGATLDAGYHDVTLGAPGPLTGSGHTAASFDGTGSYLDLGDTVPPTLRSVELWFKTTHAGGVLFSYQSGAVGSTLSGGYTPALYVGSDGHLYGEFWDDHLSPMESSGAVTDGAWHQVVLTDDGAGEQTLYLDGEQADQRSGDPLDFLGEPVFSLGAGYLSGGWPAQPSGNVQGYFDGTLAEASFYRHPLTSDAVATHYRARGTSTGPAPVTTAQVTDPTHKTLTYTYDPAAGGRLISATDALGHTTSYGYDLDGFLSGVTDPDGYGSTATYNDRGDVLSRTDGDGATGYYGYPAAGTYAVTDPRDDEPLSFADARSSGPDDTTYATDYTYDADGNPLTTTDPDQHTTYDTYTTGTEAAVGGGTEPAGLPATVKDPRGEVTSYSYDSAGDLAQVVTPSGLTTNYDYDDLGRRTRSVQVSDSYPAGVTTSYSYDADNRPLTETDPAATDAVTGTVHTPRTTDSYDDDGDLLSQAVSDLTGGDRTRTTLWHYDAQDRVDSSTDPAQRTTGYGYDAYGDVDSRTDPDGDDYSFLYSPTGELLTTTLENYTGDPENPTSPTALVLDSRAYDPAGRLAFDTDAMGRTVSYEYDDADRLTETDLNNFHEPDGTVDFEDIHHWIRDAAGHLVEYFDRGAVTDYTVDPAGLTTTSVFDGSDFGDTPLDRTTDYTYDADGDLLTSAETGGGASQETDYTYDALGDRLTQSVQDGSTPLVTSWTYDQRGLPTSTTDPRGNASGADAAAHTTDYVYDEAGRPTQRTAPVVDAETYGTTAQPVHPITLYGYDTFGDRTTVDDPDGDITTSTFDADSEPLAVSEPAYTPPGSSTPITPSQIATYTPAGRIETLTDGRGGVTHYTYDQLGDLARTVQPEVGGTAPTTHATYDADGELLSLTDPTGATTDHTYDDFGEQLTTSQVVRQPTQTVDTTHYDYDYAGDVDGVTLPDGQQTTADYDRAGDLLSVTDGDQHTTHYSYGLDGQVTGETLPDGTSTANTYDEAGRLTGTASLDADGDTLTSRSYGYDEDGNQTSATDGDQHTTHYAYDALGDLTGQTEPVSGTASITTGFGYDAAGHQTRSTDGAGNATYTTYNPLGLPESSVEPATADFPDAGERTTTVSYDGNGDPVTVTRPGGVTVTSVFDADGDLTGQTGSGAEAATQDRSFGYDADGRLTSAGAPGGTDTYTYDDRGDLLTAAGPSGDTGYAYDADGRPTSRTDASGTATFGYDGAGNLRTALDPLTGTTSTYSYNDDEQLTGISYGSGNAAQGFAYNQRHELTGDTLTAPGGATEASIGYDYDDDGRLTTQTVTGLAGSGTNTYGYDDAGRLTSWNNGTTTTGYGYDDAGNRDSVSVGSATSTASYDARDELTGVTSGSDTTGYGYTARGTLSTVTTGASTEHLADDAFDQLSTDDSATYTHDDLGRLATEDTASFSYDGTGDTVVSDGTQTYGHDADGTPVSTETGAAAALTLDDRHGDLVGTFTAGGTTLGGSTGYDPFGQVTAASGAQTDLGYQGGWTDPATGRLATASRWYDPTTGAFTSQDATGQTPIPSVNGNPYAYADDDPLDAADPSGDNACSPSGYSPGPAYSHGRSPSGGDSYHPYDWASKTAAMDYEERFWFAGSPTQYGSVHIPGPSHWGAYARDIVGGLVGGGATAVALRIGVILLAAGYSGCQVAGTPPPPPPTARTGLGENPGTRPVGQATGAGTHAQPGTKTAGTGPGDAAPAHPEANPGSGHVAHTPTANSAGGTAAMASDAGSGALGTTSPIDPRAGAPVTLVNPADVITGSTLTTPVDSSAGGSTTTVTPIDPNAAVAAITAFPAVRQAGHVLLSEGDSPSSLYHYTTEDGHAAAVQDGAAGKVPVYRGTDRMAENAIADETRLLMSEAAQRAYFEGGSVEDALRASQEAHSSALAGWGSPDELAQAHSEFGTEMQQAYGPRSVMSFTTDPEVAKYFARGGPVYRAMIGPGEGIWQSLPGARESEVLIPNMIKVEPWAG